ncbi:MAG: hypothetical protein AVDCRST_MAG49-629 [uncultured Thermomicrobiales bacterium]|uniref:Uncharacterized protein n=1 Tax=uncultured Thermomicrobiales bacterium TaxID=1645740 RepID=A0A6J4U280_9BACT|nr:MAG: hypothetical protein AVDCRST_MAG49-629 [uncultured Thermomicrobiales bacterium]
MTVADANDHADLPIDRAATMATRDLRGSPAAASRRAFRPPMTFDPVLDYVDLDVARSTGSVGPVLDCAGDRGGMARVADG